MSAPTPISDIMLRELEDKFGPCAQLSYAYDKAVELECSRDSERAAHKDTRRLLAQCVVAMKTCQIRASETSPRPYMTYRPVKIKRALTAATAHLKQFEQAAP